MDSETLARLAAEASDDRKAVDIRLIRVDELPQLFNVLTGDMSLVGPRPERPFFVEQLTERIPFYQVRHSVKPGITGWAQVNGRNALTWDEKFALDVWYVDHRTFWLDMKIVVMTFFRVFARSGINATNTATMEEFRGGNKN